MCDLTLLIEKENVTLNWVDVVMVLGCCHLCVAGEGKGEEVNVCRGMSEVFDVFLIIPYKAQTWYVPSTFSGAECLQDKVQALNGFVICLSLSSPQLSPPALPPSITSFLLQGNSPSNGIPCRSGRPATPRMRHQAPGAPCRGGRGISSFPVKAVPPDLEAAC